MSKGKASHIFSNAKKHIEIKIFYRVIQRYSNESIKIITEERYKTLLENEKEKDSVYCISTLWKNMSWAEYNKLMKECTSEDKLTGNLKIDQIGFIDKKFRTCLSDWDVVDDTGKKIPITSEILDSLDADIVDEMVNKYSKSVSVGKESMEK